MRAALCLSGIIGGSEGNGGIGRTVDFEECYKSFKQHIIDINNADVFIHSWSEEYRDKIVDLYKPQKSIFESQKYFWYSPDVKGEEGHRFRNFSKSYSIGKSLELKSLFEKENGFTYDCVIISRFDLLFFADVDFSKYDLNYLWAGNYNHTYRYYDQTNELLSPDRVNLSTRVNCLDDLWFFSNSSIMNIFISLFEETKKYNAQENIHGTLWQHVKKHLGDPKKRVRYDMYRWFDYEIYRYKILNKYDIRGE